MADSLDKMQKRADAYFSAGKALEVIALYEQIIELDPNYAPAHSELGRVLESQGWMELAITEYAKALSLSPNNYSLESHIKFGDLWKSRGNVNEAIASYKRALNLNSSYIPAYRAWANTLIQAQRLDEVRLVYSEAELNDFDLIGAKDYSDLGIAYIERGQLDPAIACFQKAISIQPNYAPAHCNLGNALLQQSNLKEAIICFNEALSIDPEFIEVYYNLGIALEGIEKFDEAIACFEATVSLDPEFSSARQHLGQILAKKKS